MYLKCHTRTKNGKRHRYWSIVEKRRGHGGKRFDRHVLYLGEINDQEQSAWTRRISVFDESQGESRQMALFPSDRDFPGILADDHLHIQLNKFSLHHPRQWGACWTFCQLCGVEHFLME